MSEHDYSFLDKYIPYAQEVLRLTLNMEYDMDDVVGVELRFNDPSTSEWVNVHYDGEKFIILDDNGQRMGVYCYAYE